MIQEAASLWTGINKFEEILDRDPRALSFAPLAELYRKAGLLEDALAVAKRGVALYPDFAAGQMALARIYLEKSMKREGTEALESVVRITPENTEAQRLLANLYTDAGNAAAAERCLSIVNALEPGSVESLSSAAELPEQTLQLSQAAATVDNSVFVSPDGSGEFDEEEILDADILELDELVEDESLDAVSYSPFAAAPERLSLQAAAVAEPAAPVVAVEPPAPVTVASATIAELYISQGFQDKGLAVYRELLLADPENAAYRKRLNELTAPLSAPSMGSGDSDITGQAASPGSVPSSQGVVKTLEGWLSNIRRVKECRSEQP